MFTDFWRDLVSLAGLALTVVGFAFTLWQVWQAKSAAVAAKDAAAKTLEQSRRNFQSYAAANAYRYISEATIHIETKQWEKAAGRFNDLADQASQLASFDSNWSQIATDLRDWAVKCSQLAKGTRKRFPDSKWVEFSGAVQAMIQRLHGPFRPSP